MKSSAEGLNMYEYPKREIDAQSVIAFFAGYGWRDAMQQIHAHFLFDMGIWRPLPVSLETPESLLK